MAARSVVALGRFCGVALPDRIERPLFVLDTEDEWLRDEARRQALPWE
jgi:hypothetical protein